jgi:hypothetical protein
MTSPQIRERTDGLRSAKFPAPIRKQYLPLSGEHQLSLLLKTQNRKERRKQRGRAFRNPKSGASANFATLASLIYSYL